MVTGSDSYPRKEKRKKRRKFQIPFPFHSSGEKNSRATKKMQALTCHRLFITTPSPSLRNSLTPTDIDRKVEQGMASLLRKYKDVLSLGSAANYVVQRESMSAFLKIHVMSKQSVLKKRAGIPRCATNDEIEAEKSLVEKYTKEKMEKAIDSMRANFNSMRTGRANPAMLDRIEVEYHGSPVSLKSIAQISSPDASSLIIRPYDKSCLKLIEKALVSSTLGLTPSNDGEIIELTIPSLTSERRKGMSKVVSKLAEEGKVAIRNIRRDAIRVYDKLEKEKKLSQDNVKDLSTDLQKVTEEYMKKIDTIHKQKNKELLVV